MKIWQEAALLHESGHLFLKKNSLVQVLNHARDHSIRESLDFVKTWNMSQLQSVDLRDGAMAAMSKQKAVFENV
ncbi:unnamed protein product [Haemonchus placei]|uniref:Peptidase_M48 domain-containing protein n=1 Tax=Haemonchus placei TaxID=6290 RepID=A0A0N4X3N6_HAEPC|nr:unnamed protein product [Haemonchus placei]